MNMFIGMEHEKMNPLAFNFRRVLRSWLSRIPNWNKEVGGFPGMPLQRTTRNVVYGKYKN